MLIVYVAFTSWFLGFEVASVELPWIRTLNTALTEPVAVPLKVILMLILCPELPAVPVNWVKVGDVLLKLTLSAPVPDDRVDVAFRFTTPVKA